MFCTELGSLVSSDLHHVQITSFKIPRAVSKLRERTSQHLRFSLRQATEKFSANQETINRHFKGLARAILCCHYFCVLCEVSDYEA